MTPTTHIINAVDTMKMIVITLRILNQLMSDLIVATHLTAHDSHSIVAARVSLGPVETGSKRSNHQSVLYRILIITLRLCYRIQWSHSQEDPDQVITIFYLYSTFIYLISYVLYVIYRELLSSTWPALSRHVIPWLRSTPDALLWRSTPRHA